MLSSFFHFVYPDKCICCGEVTEPGVFICSLCREKIPFIKGKTCDKCGKPLDKDAPFSVCANCRKEKYWYKKCFVPFVYKDCIRDTILLLKFANRPGKARVLGSFMLDAIDDGVSFDAVTYVPLHPLRYIKRGYNQSKLLAQIIASQKQIPLIRTLRKIKHTKKQSLLSSKDRRLNVKGAYRPLDVDIKGKTVLLVDDIYTTGSTIQECTKMLIRAGAKDVYPCVCAIASE